jgi:hypothetical protein
LDPVRKGAQRPAQGLPVDARSGTRLDDADRLLRDVDPGVAPRIAEALVEPVGELRRGDRSEAIGELHMPAVSQPYAGEHPRERPSVVRLGDGVVDKRCCAKLTAARRCESAAGPDEADREIQARGGGPGHGDPRLALRRSADVHAPDRRSARQPVALEEGDRPERDREDGHEAGDEREDDQRPPCAAARPPNGGEERA